FAPCIKRACGPPQWSRLWIHSRRSEQHGSALPESIAKLLSRRYDGGADGRCREAIPSQPSADATRTCGYLDRHGGARSIPLRESKEATLLLRFSRANTTRPTF